jgi:uncharacterized membrane protein YbhN (UPF0104 family)
MLKRIFALIGIFLLGVIIYSSWPDINAAIKSNPVSFIILIILNYLIYWLQCKAFCLLIDPERSFKGAFPIWGISNLLNYITAFHTGLLLRGIYFMDHGYQIKEIAYKTFLLMTINLIFAVLLLLFSTANFSTSLAITLLLFIAHLYYKSKIKEDNTRLNKTIKNIHQSLTPKILTLTAANNALLITSIYLTLPIFGLNIDFITATQIASSLSLSSVISLMPNNLGIQEGIFILYMQDQATKDAISVSAFFRCASITAGLTLVIYKARTLIKIIRTH